MCPTFICSDISFYSLQCNKTEQTLNCHTVLLSLNRLAHINYKLSGKSIYTCYMTYNMRWTGAKNNYIVTTTRWKSWDKLTAIHCRMRSVFLPFTFEWSWRCKYGNTSSITWEASTCKHRHNKKYKQESEAPDRNVHVCACADFFLSAQQHFPGFKASLFLSVESQCLDECLALIGRIMPRLWGRSGSQFSSCSCFSLHLYLALLNM